MSLFLCCEHSASNESVNETGCNISGPLYLDREPILPDYLPT